MNDSSGAQYIGSAAWMTVFSIIFVVIVSGNLMTILAIGFNKDLSSITANKFIYSLAVSDLLVGLYIPYHLCFYIYNDVLGGEEVYCIIFFIIPVFTCSHSICKLLTIAADRYIAIVYPLHYNRYMTTKMVWTLILGGWVLTITWSTIPIYYNDWNNKQDCDIVNFLPAVYFNYMLTPLFAWAWLTMSIVYVKIWREARRHAKRVKRANNLSRNAHVSDSKSLQVVTLSGSANYYFFITFPDFII